MAILPSVKEWLETTFGVKEAYELPAKMMDSLMDPDKLDHICEDFRKLFPDLSHDYLRDYFQDCAADRKTLKQDYTPESICQIVADQCGPGSVIADVCAGTGALTIGHNQMHPGAEYICYELSGMALPFLLLNLNIRKTPATVVNGDVLAEEYKAIYKCQDGKIAVIDDVPDRQADAVIMNPPYSLKWDGHHDLRFGSYETPPKKAADFAFVLIGLQMLKPGGRVVAVLPHGPLFRGQSEGKIRDQLLQDRLWKTVIGLPDALFQETDIPVQISVFAPSDDGVFFLDASELFEKHPKQNVMLPEHVQEVISICRLRQNVERKSHLASWEELQEHDGNLNIPRYVDTFVPEPLPDMHEVLTSLIQNAEEIRKAKQELNESIQQLAADDPMYLNDELKGLFAKWASV